MKKFIIGVIVGAAMMLTGSIYAEEGLQKIEAYLRPTLPITLNGQEVTLESSPVIYDGSTYLKLRDISTLTGLEVNWNDATQTVELRDEGGTAVTDVPKESGTKYYDSSGNLIPPPKVINETPVQTENEKKIYELQQQLNAMYIRFIELENVLKHYRDGKKEKDKAYEDAYKENEELKVKSSEISEQIKALQAE